MAKRVLGSADQHCGIVGDGQPVRLVAERRIQVECDDQRVVGACEHVMAGIASEVVDRCPHLVVPARCEASVLEAAIAVAELHLSRVGNDRDERHFADLGVACRPRCPVGRRVDGDARLDLEFDGAAVGKDEPACLGSVVRMTGGEP